MYIPFHWLCIFIVYTHSFAKGIAFSSIKGIILGKDISANDILWFLLVLFQVRLFGTIFIRKPFPSFFLWGVLSIALNYYQLNILYIGTTLMALPFYLYGYYAKEFTYKIVYNKWSFLLSIVFLCLTVLISQVNGKVSMMAVSYGKYDIVAIRGGLFYLNGIIGSYMLMTAVEWIKKKLQWLLFPSRCALSIVGLQVIPIMIWYKSIGFNQNYLLSFAYTILILFICVFFHLFIGKKVSWIVGGK